MPTVNNALPTEAVETGALPDIDPDVKATLRTVPVEDPTGHALDAFYARLKDTEARKAGAVTRVLYYGDSTIASDYVSGTVRRRLQARYGDAGHGFILIANPWEWYFHNDVLHGSDGDWKASKLAGPIASDGYYGLGGVSFASYGGGVGALRHGHARRLRAEGEPLRPLLPGAARRGRRRARREGVAPRSVLDARRCEGLPHPLGARARRRGEARAARDGRRCGAPVRRGAGAGSARRGGRRARLARGDGRVLAASGQAALERPARAARPGAHRVPVRHQRERPLEARSRRVRDGARRSGRRAARGRAARVAARGRAARSRRGSRAASSSPSPSSSIWSRSSGAWRSPMARRSGARSTRWAERGRWLAG